MGKCWTLAEDSFRSPKGYAWCLSLQTFDEDFSRLLSEEHLCFLSLSCPIFEGSNKGVTFLSDM